MRAVLVATLIGLTGCASDSPRKPAELPAIEEAVVLKLRWRVDTGDLGYAALQPAVHGDAVFVATADGRLGRYVEGQERWRIDVGQPLSGGVSTNGDLVVVGTAKGEVIAFSADDGAERWRGRVSSEVLAPVVFAGERVLVRSGDHRLFALDVRDGSRQWTMQRSTPALTLRVNASPVAAADLVFMGYPGGKLLAVGQANGAVLWEGSVSLPKGTTELERIADIAGSPVLGPREVCAVAYQGRVACFDLNSGNLIWAQEVSAHRSIAIDSNHVYVVDTDSVVHAFARSDGKPVWKQEALKWRKLGAPMVRQGLLLVGDGDGMLHALRQADGTLAGRLEIGGKGAVSDPVAAGEDTLFQTQLNGLVAVAIE